MITNMYIHKVHITTGRPLPTMWLPFFHRMDGTAATFYRIVDKGNNHYVAYLVTSHEHGPYHDDDMAKFLHWFLGDVKVGSQLATPPFYDMNNDKDLASTVVNHLYLHGYHQGSEDTKNTGPGEPSDGRTINSDVRPIQNNPDVYFTMNPRPKF